MYVENKTVEAKHVGEGTERKVLTYSKNLMLCELHFEAGAVGAMHAHPHEQIGYLVSGRIIYHEEGQPDKELVGGDCYQVAPNVKHGIHVLEKSVLLDIFTPMREDFV